MNVFQRYLEDGASDRYAREQRVLDLSSYIAAQIDIKPSEIDSDVRFTQLYSFDIVVRDRAFTNGWVKVFEITPKGAEAFGGSWYGVTAEGTRTVNAPPLSKILEFKKELEAIL